MGQKLVMVGISRKGRTSFMTKKDNRIQAGQYNKFQFAQSCPDQYQELIKAGLPSLGDGRGVLITVKS